MTRTKTTVYLDPSVLRAMRVAAARRGRRDSDIVEEALRRFLGLEAIAATRERSGLDEEEAMRLADEEVHAYRRDLRTRPR
jgi:predicted transcriptional regulator